MIWHFVFRLEPIFASAPAASKNNTHSKVVKCDPKIIISLLSQSLGLNHCYGRNGFFNHKACVTVKVKAILNSKFGMRVRMIRI